MVDRLVSEGYLLAGYCAVDGSWVDNAPGEHRRGDEYQQGDALHGTFTEAE